MTAEMKKSFTLRITQANKSGLIEILYEMLLTFTEEAGEMIDAGNRTGLHDKISSARRCLNELMNSVNFDYEPASTLMSLYLYVNRELLSAERKKSRENLSNVAKVITPLRDAYIIIAQKDDSPAVMSNTQTVVAGLTYTPGAVSENMSESANRGFLV